MEFKKSPFSGPYNYTLFIEGSEKNRFLKYKLKNSNEVNFEMPVTLNRTPKIYIIQHGNNIVYVGYAGQPIANRLQGGLKANGENGYHGYGWKKYDEVNLSVFVFEPYKEGTKMNKVYNDDLKLFVEGVEAEIVFKIRTETGSWPESQSEIHFNNKRQEEVRNIANEIYKKVTA